ncbi:MAG TPA: hypothetical protein VFR61_00560 [Nitrososphaeraceae archaeon]|jgi:hypothetical protein|nr:hypothetical protein [Nitrososphaeraceae archaeon]
MQKSQIKRGSQIVGIITNILIANLLATNFSITSSLQTTHGACRDTAMKYPQPRTSMALSGSNIYLRWWDNKTGIMRYSLRVVRIMERLLIHQLT